MSVNNGPRHHAGVLKLNYIAISDEVVKLQQRQIIRQQKIIRELREKKANETSRVLSTECSAIGDQSGNIITGSTANSSPRNEKASKSKTALRDDIVARKFAQKCLLDKEREIREMKETRNQVFISETAVRKCQLEKLRKFQKIQSIKLQKERYLVLREKAILFHQNKLKLKTFHSLAFFTKTSKEIKERAVRMHDLRLLRKYFTRLKTASRVSTIMRDLKCVAFYQWALLKRTWLVWRQMTNDAKMKRQVSEDYNDIYSLKLGFFTWKQYVNMFHKLQEEKSLLAQKHNNKKLLLKYFHGWKGLQEVNRLERQRLSKLLGWKLKISDLIPDLKLA